MIDALFGPTTRLLAKSMDLRMVRQGYLASNVANAETPNYRSLDIDFKATMEQLLPQDSAGGGMKMLRSDPAHLQMDDVPLVADSKGKQIVFAASDDLSIGNDSNSVNLEAETAKLQENALMYSATTQLLAKKMKGIAGIIDSTSRF